MNLYLIRHGDTAWSLSGQHTGRTDIPLTAQGEQDARALAEALRAVTFSRVFTSPRQRAQRTCELVGLDAAADIEPDGGRSDAARRGAGSLAGQAASGTHSWFETAPDLVSGIELATNGHKVAWSIADYLASLEKGVGELLDRPAASRPSPEITTEPQAVSKSR